MDTCRCDRHGAPPAGRRVSRRSTLLAAGIAAANIVTTSFAQKRASAQAATPAATPQPSDLPDLTGVTPLPLNGERLAAFEAYIKAKVAGLGVPGAAVAVVQGGEVAFLQGFGVRELGQPAPITADTLLRIGSVTKSFSAMLVGTLVDAGRLSWETPLADLLPTFAVADPELAPRLTMRDAFCACSGLPRRDLEFQFRAQELTPELLIEDMARLPLTAPFGEKFQYSNQMVAAGGFAAAVADGGAADDLAHAYAVSLRDRVLNPIGMPRTTLSLSEVVAANDYAIPHAPDLEGNPVPLPLLLDDEWITFVEPTGALWSSTGEMARYIQTELDRGVAPDGGRVVSAENLEKTWEPGVARGFGSETPAFLNAATSHYALGWEAGTYGGQRLVSHTGSTYGFNSRVCFLPDSNLGLVVLTNRNGTGGLLALATQFRLFELLFVRPETIDAMLEGAIAGEASGRASLLSHLGQVDPEAVNPFLGRYTNPDLGEMVLVLRAGALVFDAGGARSALRPRLDDAGAVANYVFIDPPWGTNPPAMHVTFEAGGGGMPRVVLTAHADPGEADLVYWYEPVDAMATPTAASD
ncbi:MAG: beta-lactamase family protein [Chloroflexota bacterium]|nr:beta-lactamase family protein [Chloroflexota bacterium]